MRRVPEIRVRAVNDRPLEEDREMVLYWMIATRRTRWSFGLQHALGHAKRLDRPLVVLEGLRCGARWSCDRMHRFVIQGMADNARRLEEAGVAYHPYVEPEDGAGKGLLESLARRACVVVTDEFPAHFLPRMVEAAGARIDARLEAVDSNGILPLRAADRVFPTAHSFRRFLQGALPEHLDETPVQEPLAKIELPPAPDPIPGTKRWPAADLESLLEEGGLSDLPIDHGVPPVPAPGGPVAGEAALREFVRERLSGYVEGRLDVNEPRTSGLSPYLHFGHVSSHEVLDAIAKAQDWAPEEVAPTRSGSRTGWWNMDEPSEAFLDQLVTWRELGCNMAWQEPEHESYESLPPWARKTLGEHEDDPRPHVYTEEQLDAAGTHDEVWNAAQRQLVREGQIHNYLRMLWGKKILEWSRTPRDALATMIQLNNRYALDGRDPNSTSGIFWTLGRYDRAWGPERPIFGKIRYMSSESAVRKLRLGPYLERYGPEAAVEAPG